MKIINGFDLIKYAKENDYILPAFNTTNMEMTYGIIQGLEKSELPGIIQISSNNLRLSNPNIISNLVSDTLREKDCKVTLHLDHGKSFEDVKNCVDAGFTSIMIDASHLKFEENKKLCRKVTDYCHFYNIPVEVELGSIGGKEDDINESEGKTDPELVEEFVEYTNCDLLAVSIGNVHGLDMAPRIDLDLLKKIAIISKVPLVLHGGSGIPLEVIKEAKKNNLIKINYGSVLRQIFISTFGKAYNLNNNEYNLIELSLKSVEKVAEEAKKITVEINEL